MSVTGSRPAGADPPQTEAAQAQVVRDCPRCGAVLVAGQDWCLGCGTAVTTRVERPRGWRALAALLTAGVLAAAAGLAAAFLLATDDPAGELAAAPTAVPSPAAATPAPAAPTPSPAAATPAPTAPQDPASDPAATAAPQAPAPQDGDSAGEAATGGAGAPDTAQDGGVAIAGWPEGEAAWTTVLFSARSRSAAERRARELAGSRADVGVLRSADFASLRPGYWVVFSGRHEDAATASEAAQELARRAPGAYVRWVEPR